MHRGFSSVARAIVVTGLLVSTCHPPRVAVAKTVYVEAATGAPGNSGLTPQEALPTITEAVPLLEPGDEMVVGPGVYFENPEFYIPGADVDHPVWIRAHPLGSATISSMWEDAALGQVTWETTQWDGIYSAQHEIALFGAHDGTLLFRFNTVEDLDSTVVQFYSEMEEQVVTLDLPDYGFAADGTRIYLKLPGGGDPNTQSILLSTGGDGETGYQVPAQVSSSPYVIIDGFHIQGSGTKCLYFTDNSLYPTVRNTVFEYCVIGIRLPDHGLVEWSEYTYPGLHEFAELLSAANPLHRRDAVYHLVKEYQSHEGTTSVLLEGCIADAFWQDRPSVDCEFRYNFIHETFDGEVIGHFSDSETHHNVYLYNYDNHIEFESFPENFHGENVRLHHSLLLSGSLGPISHQSDAIHGPQYVYRNVVYGLDDNGFETWTQIKSDADNATQGIHYYNNVIWGGEHALLWLSREHLRFRNNILVFTDLSDIEDIETPLDSDYNLLVNGVDVDWIRGEHGLYLGPDPDGVGFLDYGSLNFGIGGSSPAIDLGEPIPGFTDDVLDGMPDAGAFEYGEDPGSDWPRPRQTTFTCDPPERWNGDVPEDYCSDDDDDDTAMPDDDDDSAMPDDDDDSASDDDDSANDDDTRDDDEDGDSDGCSCSAVQASPPSFLIVGLVIWAAHRRRRCCGLEDSVLRRAHPEQLHPE